MRACALAGAVAAVATFAAQALTPLPGFVRPALGMSVIVVVPACGSARGADLADTEASAAEWVARSGVGASAATTVADAPASLNSSCLADEPQCARDLSDAAAAAVSRWASVTAHEFVGYACQLGTPECLGARVRSVVLVPGPGVVADVVRRDSVWAQAAALVARRAGAATAAVFTTQPAAGDADDDCACASRSHETEVLLSGAAPAGEAMEATASDVEAAHVQAWRRRGGVCTRAVCRERLRGGQLALSSWQHPGHALSLQPEAPRLRPRLVGPLQLASSRDALCGHFCSRPRGKRQLGPPPAGWVVVVLGNQRDAAVLLGTARAVATGLTAALRRRSPDTRSVQVIVCHRRGGALCKPGALAPFQVVVLGAHVLAATHSRAPLPWEALRAGAPACAWHASIPPTAIVVNTEVLPVPGQAAAGSAASPWATAEFVCLLRAFRVWDVNRANAARLARHYAVDASALQLGPDAGWAREREADGQAAALDPHGEAQDPRDEAAGSRQAGAAGGFATEPLAVPPAAAWLHGCEMPSSPSRCRLPGSTAVAQCLSPLEPPQTPAGEGSCCAHASDLLVWRDLATNDIVGVNATVSQRRDDPAAKFHVLLAGATTPVREPVIAALREVQGLRVHVAEQALGRELASLVDGSLLSLSLSAYGQRGESKLPRVLPLLARGAVVVSEFGGEPGRDDEWLVQERAVAAAARECIVPVALGLLADPDERVRVSRHAARLAAGEASPSTADSIARLLREAQEQ